MSKYFNIDDILAGEERVKVVWNADAYKLGYLDPSMSPDDVRRLLQRALHAFTTAGH